MLHDIFKWENVGKECLHVLDIQERNFLLSPVFINLNLKIADEINREKCF